MNKNVRNRKLYVDNNNTLDESHRAHRQCYVLIVRRKPVSDLVSIENVREPTLGNSGAVLISYRQFREFIIRTSYSRMVTSKNQRAKQTFIVLQDSTWLGNIEM